MLIDLSGKNALITGAGRGIGKACALELAKYGASLLINDRRESGELDQTVSEIEKLGNVCVVYPVNVFTRKGCEKLIEVAEKDFKTIDILISNPAFGTRQAFLEHDPNDFEKVIQSTLTSGFHMAQLAARNMVASKIKGKIIFISSVQAEMPFAKNAAYGAAKAGLNHLTRTIAVELSRYKINVNAIQPGWIDTPGEHESFSDESIIRESVKLPWGRMGKAEEIAKAACFLISVHADYITGTIMTVDGGFRYKDYRNPTAQEA